MATDYAAFQRALIADIREHGAPTSGPMVGFPLMVLTSTGAKSGEARTAVVTYTRDGDRYVVAASKGGAPMNPAWYHNLLANPEATVETGGETFRVRASEVRGAERDRLWNRHATERPEFRDYPARTTRVIPIVVLDRLA